MKRPRSPSRRVGGGTLVQVAGTVVLAVVLVVPAGAAYAQPVETPFGALTPVSATQTSAKPVLKVVVVGDSFTSGEGADSNTYRRVPSTETTEDGITYDTYKVDPAHQSSTAPTLQALNQIQAANPNVELQVSFVPVSGATRPDLYQTTRPGTPFEQPAQINAVKNADVVVVGIGGNDAKFTNWVKTVLSSSDSTSTQEFPKYMQQFNDGSYLSSQIKLLNDVSDLASPHAAIVSLGYPKAMPATVPNQPTWYSPFSWSTISQNEANESNQLASILSETNQHAVSIASAEHSSQQWIYADIQDALKGHELFTKEEGLNGLTPTNVQGSYHPNDLGQRLLGNALQPQIEKAINNQLERLGVKAPENVPLVTQDSSSPWDLKITMPQGMVDKHGKDLTTPQQDPAQQDPAQQDPAQHDPAQQDPAQQDPAQPADQPPGATVPDGTPPAQQDPAQPADQQPADTVPNGAPPAQQDPAQPADQQPADTVPNGAPPAQQDPAQPADQQPVETPQGGGFDQDWSSLSQALADGSSPQSLEVLRQALQGPPPDGISAEAWNSAINALQGATQDTDPAAPPAADPVTPPVADPVTPPVADPVTPPVADPVTPPVADPVTPPVADPVTPPAADPVTPPDVDPVTPPAADPITPPAADPITPPAVDPITPPAADPITPPAVDPITPPAADPITPPAVDPITPPAADPITPPVIIDPITPPPPVIDPVTPPSVDPIIGSGSSSISDPVDGGPDAPSGGIDSGIGGIDGGLGSAPVGDVGGGDAGGGDGGGGGGGE